MIAYRSTVKNGFDLSESYRLKVNGILTDGYCNGMFSGSETFNEPVIIGNNVVSCYSMFSNCYNFNQSITIPNSVVNCSYMFATCVNLKQPITIPVNVINAFAMCQHTGVQDIYLKGNTFRDISVSSLLRSKNNQFRTNVFFNSIFNNKFNVSNYFSIVGTLVEWTTMDNGFYNSTLNVYCYNNYSGV